MERKQHKEYRRIIDNADTAILFVHGIIGSPNHFEKYVPLVPDDVSICNFVIDGHCGSVEDFSKSSLQSWETSFHRIVEELSETHERIYVVGHSMGTLLTMHESLKNSKIVGAFMLNVPITIYVHPKMVPVSFRIVFDKIPENNQYLVDMVNCYGIDKDKNILKYIPWVMRFVELSYLVHKTRRILKDVKIPCVAFQGMKDEVVFPSSARYLKKHSSITVNVLEYSGHYHYDEKDMNYLLDEFKKFIEPLAKKE